MRQRRSTAIPVWNRLETTLHQRHRIALHPKPLTSNVGDLDPEHFLATETLRPETRQITELAVTFDGPGDRTPWLEKTMHKTNARSSAVHEPGRYLPTDGHGTCSETQTADYERSDFHSRTIGPTADPRVDGGAP